MNQNKLRRIKNDLHRSFKKFEKLFDPFIIIGIFLLFVIPTLSVLNLKPGTYPKQRESNVLGLTDQDYVSVEKSVTLDENIVNEFQIQRAEKDLYDSSFEISPTEEGDYSTPIFKAINPSPDQKMIAVFPEFEVNNNNTKISLQLNDTKFVVKDFDGSTYIPSIYLPAQKETEILLVVEANKAVNFSQNVKMELKVE